MTIAEAREKCKTSIAKIPRDLLIIAVLILASSASFGLGYLTGLDAGFITQTGEGSKNTFDETSFSTTTEGQVVASKSGTKYYLPSCAAADRISETNKIWFVSAMAAVSAGYTPAANCKGL